MDEILDFDSIDDWESSLTAALRGDVPDSFHQALIEANPESVGNAEDFLLNSPTSLGAVIDKTLAWLRSSTVAGYHGSRLTDAEFVSVQVHGLLPLNATSRRDRLVAALSAHPDWPSVQARLDETILKYGPNAWAGQREGQVHLALSRSDIATLGYRQILSKGSEFDQRVAGDLLGQEGWTLVAQYGKYRVLKFCIPGHVALDAANPFFGIEWERAQGGIPSLLSHFLSSWCFRQVHPKSEVDAPHCSMIFREPVPASWLQGVDTLPDPVLSTE